VVVVSSSLGFKDEIFFFFLLTVNILSPKLYGLGWEKFGGSTLNLAAPPPLFGDLWGAKMWLEIWKMEVNE
jgi:hypothetical protein